MDNVINAIAAGAIQSENVITIYQKGEVINLTLGELDYLARKTASFLVKSGVKSGDKIGILARNSLEWILLDLAAIKLKVITAGFDISTFQKDKHLISRYGLRFVFSEEEEKEVSMAGYIRVDSLRSEIDDLLPGKYNNTYQPDDTTTLKFTSGSTGHPKGLAARVGSINRSLTTVQQLFRHNNNDKLFVFLPLSLLQQRYWIYSALFYGFDIVVSGYETSFYAISRENPTVIMGVPSFYETIKNKIVYNINRNKNAKNSTKKMVQNECVSKILGPNIRYFWTGSAPINKNTLQFFSDLGLAIYEGYGLNETCIVSKNYKGANKLGSVGKLVEGKQVVFDKQGAIVVKSEYPVNTAYTYCQDGESEKVFSKTGDVYTGDIGYIDDEGYLYVTGRVNDLISLSNGRNIFGGDIENMLKTSPLIENCVIQNRGGTNLTAIISPAKGIDEYNLVEHIKETNRKLPSEVYIGSYIISDMQFSIANGLLSSQYKPRRKKIYEHFAEKEAITI